MVSGCRTLHTWPNLKCAALSACTFVAVLSGCDSTPEEEEVPIRPVRYAEVVIENATVSRTYSGTAKAELEIDLSFRVGGAMVERPVNVGSTLATGDIIASLDKSDFQVRLDEALAGLARAEAERRNANANFGRTRNLYETQNTSRAELDSARSFAESGRAQYRTASQHVAGARLQLSYATLTAPQACTVAQTYAQLNQNVSPGQPIVRVNCGDCAEIVVSVPETDISRIKIGDAVLIDVSALAGEPFRGTVSEVGIAAAGNGSTFSVTIGLEEQCTVVRSGMAADVMFSFRDALPQGKLIVPYVAVGEDRNGNFVFALEPIDVNRFAARRRRVTIGEATAHGIVIEDGVALGELVATAGVRRLQEGQLVSLLGETTNEWTSQ